MNTHSAGPSDQRPLRSVPDVRWNDVFTVTIDRRDNTQLTYQIRLTGDADGVAIRVTDRGEPS